jgi:hypothetical protein
VVAKNVPIAGLAELSHQPPCFAVDCLERGRWNLALEQRTDRAQTAQVLRTGFIGHVGRQNGDEALGMAGKIGPAEDAFGFAATRLAEGQEPAEARIGRAVRRIDQDRHAVCQIQPAADDQPDAGFLGRLPGAHDPGKAVAINNAKRFDAECLGRGKQLIAA